MKKTQLSLLIAALLTSANLYATESAKPAEVVPAPQADGDKKTIDLSGSWGSTQDDDLVTIEQKGDKVIATYEYAEDSTMYVGKIEGTLKGKVIDGTWSEKPKAGNGESSNGSVELTIVDDKTLLGRWRSEGAEDWKGDWNLQKK